MLNGIIVRVADGELSGMIAVTGTPSAVVIIGPLAASTVVPLFADIGAGEMIFAGITARYDTGKRAVREPFDTIDVVESIDD